MKKHIFSMISGLIGAAIATTLAFIIGVQSRNWRTLYTLNSIAGISAAYLAKASKEEISDRKLERAIGAINERYALNPSALSVATALEELKNEVRR
ncbi:hypothetical protein QPK87_25300 [Kamptonema cortianum]|nr:hypothetical protein [Kamptonema cortianum]